MKQSIELISVKSKKSPEFEKIFSNYKSKILNYSEIAFHEIKSFEAARNQKDLKVNKESQAILEKIRTSSFIILCDEVGEEISSFALAELISNNLGVYKKITFVIGGAFGVNDQVREQANLILKLSPFVLNHLVAKTVLLEQIYRTFTIINKLPYHNE